ncbi:MAG: Stp1/IreP family PP2C-type Ser/Thr phosphatase [Clostridia bacterium]|nr:Stp1/IreP family PP2C-type Ser/Thr phosphatase [Clostridia bacterium]
MKFGNLSQVGQGRNNNEDSVFADENLKLFIVADGMGGAMAGEVASAMAVKGIVESLKNAGRENPEDSLREAVYYANDLIYTQSDNEENQKGMGTTITIAWLKRKKLFIANVGDSRAYMVRGNAISQITKDHSVVEQLVREGGITSAQAKEHPNKHILTRALGCEPRVEVDVYALDVKKGDRLLLCTDGMSNAITTSQILTVLSSVQEPRQMVEQLVELAVFGGSADDISAIVVDFSDNGEVL